MKLRCRPPSPFAFMALAGLFIGCGTMSRRTPEARLSAAQSTIASWPGFSGISAAIMIDEYGPPDRIEADRLVWNDKGFCKRLIAWNVKPYAGTGAEDIESIVAYPVPPESRAALAQFSSQLQVAVNGTELSARSTTPNLNFLLLNLAHEVIAGNKTPAQAREFYERTVMLSIAGKTSPLMQGLLSLPESARRGPYPLGF